MVDFILTSGLVQIKREYDEKFGFDTEVFGGDPIVVKWDGDTTKIEYYSLEKCEDGKLEVIRYSGPAMDQICKIEVYISKEIGIDKELKERLNKISINILDKYGC